jgi:hypothetical protein
MTSSAGMIQKAVGRDSTRCLHLVYKEKKRQISHGIPHLEIRTNQLRDQTPAYPESNNAPAYPQHHLAQSYFYGSVLAL